MVKDYKLFQFHEDPYVNNSENILPGEHGEVIEPISQDAIKRMKLQNEANVTNGGKIPTANHK